MEKKISIQLLSQFRMYLPMKQVIVYVPFSGSEKVSEKDLNDFLFDVKNIRDAEHLGKRTGRLAFLCPDRQQEYDMRVDGYHKWLIW